MNPWEVDLFCRERIHRTGMVCEEMLEWAHIEARSIRAQSALVSKLGTGIAAKGSEEKGKAGRCSAVNMPRSLPEGGTSAQTQGFAVLDPNVAETYAKMSSFESNERVLIERIRKASNSIRQVPSYF